ncbi:MAG: deoxyribodipyrimidine photo-lyase [Geminicoccaceae bacterium]
MASSDAVILWFRRDLRLADNPALAAALESGRPLLPLHVLDDDAPGPWRPGAAARWWLHHSLARLQEALRRRGAALVLRRGAAGEALDRLIVETGAAEIHWNRLYEPWAIVRDGAIKDRLKRRGIRAQSHNAALVAEPWELATGAGRPYKMFTPFWRALRARATPTVGSGGPRKIPAPARPPAGDALADWNLLPRLGWAGGIAAAWTPGEDGALRRLGEFLDERLADYATGRDRLDLPGTSRLSPHLHWREVGPRQIWQAVATRADADPALADAAEAHLRELGWREFSHHLLFHWPELPEAPWRAEFARFAWRDDPAGLEAWQRGRTGYPIVDAGMRELWATGWMHNRVRMIAASFLVKDLLLPWQAGEAWFWDTLVDADLAQSAASWQWVAGSGADAAPYFRVFNPVSQGEKFDPRGAYVRRWVPELAELPDRWLHRPWTAPAEALAAAGVALGDGYPLPCVDHGVARGRALSVWQAMRRDEEE